MDKFYNRSIMIGLLLLLCVEMQAQQPGISVYPSHWWTGMKTRSLQLLFHATDNRTLAANKPVAQSSSSALKINQVHTFSNKKYLAVDVEVAADAKPGVYEIKLGPVNGSEWRSVSFELKARSTENGKTRIKGISSADLIYLIMPDRFSNGDPSNDHIGGMLDSVINRQDIFARHGGDLKGVENHLDYLQELGVTAVWLNPVLENNMPSRSEHGYAFTDHYQVDKRLGGNAAYYSLIRALHGRGMKIIQDAVYNHVGTQHFLYKDLPDSSWFHFWPVYTNTTFKDQVLMDPYAAPSDKKKMSDGWFVPGMPDINQRNPFFANFLIEHAIWSTEEFGLDGWRVDTYAYNDLEFMNRCNQALLNEYPQLHIFGETWVHGMVNQSFFTRNVFNIPYKSNLPGVTDFQLNLYGIVPALTQPFGWTDGVNRLYLTATNDFVYQDATKNVIFLDNHDLSRIFSIVGEDTAKQKTALAWLLTYRGIPQLYYGTEILLKNFSDPDGRVRQDFPGGWAGDSLNKFTAAGRSKGENEVFNYVKTLAQFRKKSSALQAGKMMQYVPENGVYVYFRYNNKQTVMCVMNSNVKESEVDIIRFSERIKGFTRFKDIATGNVFELSNKIVVPGSSMLVAELLP